MSPPQEDPDPELFSEEGSILEGEYLSRLERPLPFKAPLFPRRVVDAQYAVDIVEGKDYSEPLRATREALNEVIAHIQSLVASVPTVGEHAVSHVLPTVDALVLKMNLACDAIKDLCLLVGDLDGLKKEGFGDLTSAVMSALSQLSTTDEMGSLRDRIEEVNLELEELQGHVFEELGETIGSLTLLCANQFKGILDRIAQMDSDVPRDGVSEQPTMIRGNTLMLDCMLVDGDGIDIMTLGDVVSSLRSVEADLAELKCGIADQGGVVFGSFSFNSRASLEAFIIKENVSGKSFPAFVCAHSIFSHDVESSSVSEDQKLLARQGISAPTTRRYITLFQERYNRPYTGEKKTIDAGTKISALSSILKWRGESGQDGESQKIKSTLRTASATAKTYADNNLPLGQARELAKELISPHGDSWTCAWTALVAPTIRPKRSFF